MSSRCRRYGGESKFRLLIAGPGLHGRLRDECLNETPFSSLAEARRLLGEWRDDYNRVRPHSALANRTPEDFRLHTQTLAANAGNGQTFNPELSP